MGGWALVIPVKRLDVAKTRLTEFAGERRRDLALAFAADTVAAAGRCPAVRGVVVVSDDPAAIRLAEDLGCLHVPDEPDAGLNPALLHGAAAALASWPRQRVAALSSDLPALRADELSLALAAADGLVASFVSDTAGLGTTLLAAESLAAFAPRFGADSAAAPQAAGAIPLETAGLESVRRDVDTEADLSEAATLGLGRRTSQVLAGVPRWAGPIQATVRTYDVDLRLGTLVRDDGTILDFDSAAVVAGRLRLLRPGQRVHVSLSPQDRLVSRVGLDLPP
jgi:2-phospho-L-lactate guanylyltransferase